MNDGQPTVINAYTQLADRFRAAGDAQVKRATTFRAAMYKRAEEWESHGRATDDYIQREEDTLNSEFKRFALDEKIAVITYDQAGADEPRAPQGEILENAHRADEHQAAERGERLE
jgi:hypothetical protein